MPIKGKLFLRGLDGGDGGIGVDPDGSVRMDQQNQHQFGAEDCQG